MYCSCGTVKVAMQRVVFLRNVKKRPFEAALFFAKILKIVRFVKSILQHSLRVRLNNRILFSKICYCGVEKKAVILHLIKNGLFLTPKS